MENTDFDEAEKKRRKDQAVAWREKRRKSTIFMLVASLFEIIESIIIILILFLLTSLFFLKILNPENTTVQLIYQGMIIVDFIGGIVIGFFVYKRVLGWVIRKFNLIDVLSDDVVNHYVKKTKEEKEEALKK